MKSGKRIKKGWKIAGGVLVAFLILQQFVMGWYGGMGLLPWLKDIRRGQHPGNKPEYNFDSVVPMENSPLAGKHICVLGSSVVFGSEALESGVGEFLSARFDCQLTKEAVNGTTLADVKKNSYVSRMKNKLDAQEHFDLLVCQLSTNDATQDLPLGEISTGTELSGFDTSTVTGAMEYIICYARETWGCPVVFFTGSRYDNVNYEKMVARLLELQDKYGIGLLDLWSDDMFNSLTDDQRALYMVDGIHPSKAGYRDWWGPEMERQLVEYLSTVENN